MRVASTRFHSDRVEIIIGDVIPLASPASMMEEVVAQFAAAVAEAPTNWLMLQHFFRDA